MTHTLRGPDNARVAVSLLVFSTACFEDVNRTVYRLLQHEYGIPVHLVIPASLGFPGGSRQPVDIPGEILPITKLKFSGGHPRLQVFEGAAAVVSKLRPSHILVDIDPASLMMVRTARWARQFKAKLWAISCENLQRNYLVEALNGLLELSPKAFAGGVLTHVFSLLARPDIDRVFTISRDGTEVMEALGVRGRVTQMPLGFDETLFFPQSPQKIADTRKQCGVDQPAIAYFGRMVPEKGVDLLIRALAGLMHTRWQLLLDDFQAYQSPYQAEILRLLAATGVGARTVFFRSNHRDIPDYMNAADIVVLPSITTAKWKEQYGRVIPEAMACGKVVIGSRSGALPELIGDCGFVVAERDVDELRTLLAKLLSMSPADLCEIGARAARRAHSQLSATRQAEILFSRLMTNE